MILSMLIVGLTLVGLGTLVYWAWRLVWRHDIRVEERSTLTMERLDVTRQRQILRERWGVPKGGRMPLVATRHPKDCACESCAPAVEAPVPFRARR